MLSDITIIVPTYNRPRQLNRLLKYYSKSKFQIIIGDSSPDIFPDLKKYRNVKYYHYPNFSYAKKLPLIYDRVKTKYVLFCADDDFVISSGIKKCVEFLEKNKDYNSAHGHYLFFEDRKSKEIISYPFYLYAMDIDINGESSSDRVKQLLTNYMQLLYTVNKTKDIKHVFNLLKQHPQIKNDALVELFQAIILCIQGKSKTLTLPYCVREVTPHSARTRVPSLERIIFNPKYQEEYKSWFKTITQFLAAKQKISRKEAEGVFQKSITVYLKPYLYRVPLLNLNLYPLEIQTFIINKSLGLAKKTLDILRAPQVQSNLSKHVFHTSQGKEEYKEVLKFIEKHRE